MFRLRPMQVERDDRRQQRERNGNAGDGGGAKVEEKQKQHHDHQHGADQQRLPDIVQRDVDGVGGAKDVGVNGDSLRLQAGAQVGQRRIESARDLQRVGSIGGVDDHDDAGSSANGGFADGGSGRVGDAGDVAQRHVAAVVMHQHGACQLRRR